MNILIVDDSKVIRLSAKNALMQEGRVINCCENAREAYALAHTNRYDMALIDVVMPGLNGFYLCELLHEQWPSLKIWMLTGKSSVTDHTRALAYGAQGLIMKPFSNEELQAKIQ